MSGKVSKNMAMGAGIIGFILIGCGLGCAVAGFVWTAYGKGAHGVWSGIFVSTLYLYRGFFLISVNRFFGREFSSILQIQLFIFFTVFIQNYRFWLIAVCILIRDSALRRTVIFLPL